MEQYRVVDTPSGPLTYLLVKKRVKNLNLRIDRQGQVVLSVPLRCSPERADAFIAVRLDGEPVREYAARIGANENNITQKLKRAAQKLKENYKDRQI